ncbi:TPA: pyocin killing protein [Pseudomonas aeruginosa]|nr:pyocin killing protein [Pseudomonas aeruginosa]HBO6920024.1 pyocin killing protein [Pseudomonas aeruginosa]HBO6987132.1 pyocin killing protein [Pseudomonas aeruginosa]HBO7064639.1 pyocin killing protein [Pseudomonas aeruginosa]HBO7208722.1 pyocin killing protein [Pseudomonas aeruginosa]
MLYDAEPDNRQLFKMSLEPFVISESDGLAVEYNADVSSQYIANLQGRLPELEKARVPLVAEEKARQEAEAEAQRKAEEEAQRAADEAAARQEAQQVTQQLGANFNAITAPMGDKVQQRVQAVDTTQAQISGQIGSAVTSATQSVQAKAAEAQQHASSSLASGEGLISSAFRGQIASAAQASGESRVSAFNTRIDQIVSEATSFSEARKQALTQFTANAAAEVEAETARLAEQVRATPTQASSESAQAALRQFTESTYSNVNTFAQQTEAALQAKAQEITEAIAEAQRVANEGLQQAADGVQGEITQAANTLAMPAIAAPLVSVAGFGTAALELAQLGASLANAVNRVTQVVTAGPGAYVATFAVLTLYSDQAGKDSDKVPDGVRTALALEASTLGLSPDADLKSAAEAGGTVDMPVRLTSRTEEDQDNKSQIAVVVTNAVPTPQGVPVRAATFNPATGRYEVTVPAKSTVPDAPPLILTWTPANPPGSQNPSSTTPVVPQPVPVYEGATITSVQAEPESYPGVPLSLDDLIVSFPADSGIKPIYVMFNSPYGETNARGKYSGRDYNTEKAGGPILDLDWRTAKIDRAGVDKVKLHTGRFGESPENKVMIDRLERILKGELQITDTDKRFYTHEIRELERYRNLGIKDREIPENYDEVWNNTHSATLEDYKIDERTQPLYTPEADEAYFKSQEGK